MKVQMVKEGVAYLHPEEFDRVFDIVTERMGGEEFPAKRLLAAMGVRSTRNMIPPQGPRPVDRAAELLTRDIRDVRGYLPQWVRRQVQQVFVTPDVGVAYLLLDEVVEHHEALTRPLT